jgi:DNA invertase Pin-like site-specific DNA recombinase
VGERATWGKGKLATTEQVEKVKTMKQSGHSVRAISRATGLSKSQVDRLVRGEVKSA